MTSVLLDRDTAKLGQEIRIVPAAGVSDWSGEAAVNTTHKFPLLAHANGISVTRKNGFSTLTPTEICVSLKDRAGKEIRVNPPCLRLTVSEPMFVVQPLGDLVGANGGSGRIQIRAPSKAAWSPGGAPDWVTLSVDLTNSLESVIQYKVAPNRSKELRRASMSIGDSGFELSQSGSPYVDVPYTADLNQPPIPVWEVPDLELKTGRSDGAPPRWVLDNQPGQGATVRVAASDAPQGGSAYVVERPPPEAELWKTQVWLPGIRTEEGGKYAVRLWLKSDNPTEVALEIAPREAPFRRCGLFEQMKTTAEWKEFTFHFQGVGGSCRAETNRIALQCGRVSGKLWISGFSLTKQ